jgi:hypothetical protein
MKKILSLVLVLAMVLGSFSFTFAASDVTADIQDDDVKAAVERLVAFGIVNGMDDGKYHPEEVVTREQFAKIVVEALGLGTAADAAKGSTQFTDVATDRWSVGYINTAVGQGILKGYPDGTFQPAKEVSYAEAATMLVRALGYQDEFLTGSSWPQNYLAKAADLDITDNVRISATGAADRGSVAVMVNNTLDAEMIEQESYGDDNNWSETGITLLQEKLEVVKYEDAVVTATPKVDSTIDDDQLSFKDATYVDDDGKEQDEVEDTFDVTIEGLSIDSLLGLSLNIYVNDDDEIVYVEESDENYKVIYDVVDGGEDIKEDSITLKNLDKEYEFNEDNYKIYIDNAEKDVADLENEASEDEDNMLVYGKFVLDNKGNIVVADLQEFDGDLAGIVTSVDGEEIIYNMSDADDENSIDLADDDYDSYVITDVEGNVMDVEDIQEDDIVYVNEKDLDGDDLEEAASGDTVIYVVVVRDVLEGAATSYDIDDKEIEIDDETYDVNADATVSVDEDDEYVEFASADSELDDITDAEADVIALRDIVGDVRHIRTDVDSSSDELYGVVTATNESYDDVQVKILNYDEDEVEYEFDLDDIYGFDPETSATGDTTVDEFDIKKGDIVKYTVDSDGDIDMISFIGYVAMSDIDTTNVLTDLEEPDTTEEDEDMTVDNGDVTDDYGDDSVEIDGKDYVVDNNIAIFDLTAVDDDYDDAEYVDYEGLVDKSEGAKVVYALDDDDAVVFMAFVGDFDANDDEQAGYVVNQGKKDGDYVLKIVLPGSDDTVKYTVDEAVYDPDDEQIVVFEEGSDGDIDLIDVHDGKNHDYTTITGMVSDKSGSYLTLTDYYGDEIAHYKFDSDCIYYNTDDEASKSELKENETMVTIAVKDAKIQVVKIFDIDYDDLDDEYDAFVDAYDYDNAEYDNTKDVDDIQTDILDLYDGDGSNDKYDDKDEAFLGEYDGLDQ